LSLPEKSAIAREKTQKKGKYNAVMKELEW
jgi:hypothetical protein